MRFLVPPTPSYPLQITPSSINGRWSHFFQNIGGQIIPEIINPIKPLSLIIIL